ncbi:hypothetical protein K437DRAFT_294376 [Tilletiaria anomala UBC 951]|uniref:RanBD1 domain-containing protein n=1 Tax=Tilletiaria anomala (strain ATCC 24038 / CBS 436.72 / UBC 951) TaxID=1037660 RepID=A0A066VX90_TILAU|nr:uncharacterized protein K437DRAFT_294376 [Tilletiaria anomala UBC 951]KDN46116.1 hypothetical protein K437DRAFT_294376 [Tilletiaria anomala UBC 951]
MGSRTSATSSADMASQVTPQPPSPVATTTGKASEDSSLQRASSQAKSGEPEQVQPQGPLVSMAATTPFEPAQQAPSAQTAETAAPTMSESTAAKSHQKEPAPESEPAMLPEKMELPSGSASLKFEEHIRRKRDREGSLEPNSAHVGPSTPDAVPAKKNRLLEHPEETDEPEAGGTTDSIQASAAGQDESAAALAPSRTSLDATETDGPGVGQIRRKVRDLDWKEQGGECGAAKVRGPSTAEEPKTTSSTSTLATATEPDAASTPARSQPTFASFSSKPSASATTSGGASAASSSPFGAGIAATTDKSKSSLQPTFSSFTSSTKSSPFVTGASGSRSWLATSTGSGSAPTAPAAATGGIGPSLLGSSLDSQKPRNGSSGSSSHAPSSSLQHAGVDATVKPPAPLSSSSKGKAATPSLGFGAFASGAGFSSATSKVSAPSSSSGNESAPSSAAGTPQDGAAGAADPAVEDGPKASISDTGPSVDASWETTGKQDWDLAFQAQLATGAGESLQEREKVKLAASADALKTGEEDENTVFSARAKLYTTSESAGWKERGTGTVRCNVPRNAASKGGRLVMRTDGVLRVILNVKLFAGMSCEVAQDKFVKLVALEDGTPVNFAIRFGNPTAASGFHDAVKKNTPV